MKKFLQTMWSKPLRTVFIVGGFGAVITKIIKACKKKKS